MTTSHDIGAQGERLAIAYLTERGYTLLAQNWHSGHRELDLVMRQGERIVFVEVKARRRTDFGTPAEFVTKSKRRLLLEAAQSYLQNNGLPDAPARFDVVEVYLSSGQINHITDAFGA